MDEHFDLHAGQPVPLHHPWVQPFVAWAQGDTDVLDFGGARVPERVQVLIIAAGTTLGKDPVVEKAESVGQRCAYILFTGVAIMVALILVGLGIQAVRWVL